MAWVNTLSRVIHKRRGNSAWISALALLGLSTVVRLVLHPWLDITPFLTFYPSIGLTTLLCGWR